MDPAPEVVLEVGAGHAGGLVEGEVGRDGEPRGDAAQPHAPAAVGAELEALPALGEWPRWTGHARQATVAVPPGRKAATDENAQQIRTAYEAYIEGDYAAVLTLVDPEFEWTYLHPDFEDPEPQVCHGPGELARWMARQSSSGLTTEIVEVLGRGDKVLVVTRTPGIEGFRAWSSDDHTYHVLTLRDHRITKLRVFRSRAEALAFAES